MRSNLGSLLGPIGFCLFLLTGHWLTVGSMNNAVFVYLGEQRSPTAVRSLKDYSSLDRRKAFASVQKQMLEEAKLARVEGSMGVTLGHPLLKANGGNEFACPVGGRPGLFDRIELTFMGAGIASSGDQPRMIIESECLPGKELGTLAPVWIPMRDIVTAEAKDQELQIYGQPTVTVRLEEIPGEWPPFWVLTQVRLYRETNPDEFLLLDTAQLREVKGRLLSFDWQ